MDATTDNVFSVAPDEGYKPIGVLNDYSTLRCAILQSIQVEDVDSLQTGLRCTDMLHF
jgi:hypothetical protein